MRNKYLKKIDLTKPVRVAYLRAINENKTPDILNVIDCSHHALFIDAQDMSKELNLIINNYPREILTHEFFIQLLKGIIIDIYSLSKEYREGLDSARKQESRVNKHYQTILEITEKYAPLLHYPDWNNNQDIISVVKSSVNFSLEIQREINKFKEEEFNRRRFN